MSRTLKCASSVTLSLLCLLLVLPKTAIACTRAGPFSFNELFDRAEVIVRVTATRYAKPPSNPDIMTNGDPDSVVEFKVAEILRGKDVPQNILLNGYLNGIDDYNDMPVPYTFVRPGGRSGSCFANTYKQGADFLLFLKKKGNQYTSNISALGPSNEQLRSESDPWLEWVRNHLLETERPKGQAALTLQWLGLLLECPFVFGWVSV